MTNKTITVIIPTYNRAHTVATAIQSALAQTYAHTEIIVVDDGSADDTAAVVAQYPTVRYILQPHAGQGTARNTGLDHASGSFIASLDSDDSWHPSFLSVCMERMAAGNLGFVFANWMEDTGAGTHADRLELCSLLKPYLPGITNEWLQLDAEQLRAVYLSGCPSPSSSLLIRRSSIVAGWPGTLHIADDWCMLMDMVFSKPRTAAFTSRLLWSKHVDGTNIYNGRDQHEVRELLWINDVSILYRRFRHRFTGKERKAYRTTLARNVLYHCYHEARHKRRYARALSLLGKAIGTDYRQVVQTVLKITGRKLKKPFVAASAAPEKHMASVPE